MFRSETASGWARPSARPASSVRRLYTDLRRLYRFRELLLRWTERDIKIKYKQTVLGVAWAILQPVAMMVVLTVLFSRFYRMPSDEIPYALFAFSGLLVWTFFATSLALASTSLVSNMHLISKVAFPREILPLASVAACLPDFLIAGAIFLVMSLGHGVVPTPRLLLVPLLVLVQVVFAAAIGLLASGLCVFYRDVKYVVPFVVQLSLFVTPVMYPLGMVPREYLTLYLCLNPMAGIVEGYRRLILRPEAGDLTPIWLATVASVGLFVVAYGLFKRWEEQFADLL
jgi:lipopolysaccharide transport system permease protein